MRGYTADNQALVEEIKGEPYKNVFLGAFVPNSDETAFGLALCLAWLGTAQRGGWSKLASPTVRP
jgi:hypothetical protein